MLRWLDSKMAGLQQAGVGGCTSYDEQVRSVWFQHSSTSARQQQVDHRMHCLHSIHTHSIHRRCVRSQHRVPTVAILVRWLDGK